MQENLRAIVRKSIENNEEVVKHAIHEVDNPAITALTCSSDYLRSLTKGIPMLLDHQVVILNGLDCRDAVLESTSLTFTDYATVITTSNKIAHRHSVYIMQGRATCNTSPDIAFGESN